MAPQSVKLVVTFELTEKTELPSKSVEATNVDISEDEDWLPDPFVVEGVWIKRLHVASQESFFFTKLAELTKKRSPRPFTITKPPPVETVFEDAFVDDFPLWTDILRTIQSKILVSFARCS